MPNDNSTRWYVYAILSADAVLPQTLTGFGDAPVTLIPSGAIAAAVSRIKEPSVDASPAQLLGHETVVEAIRRVAPALPVRFGTIFPDVTALTRILAARAAILQADLARVGDKLEMGLSALWAAPEPGAAAPHADGGGSIPELPVPLRDSSGPGAQYLASRFARYAGESRGAKDTRRLAQRVDAALRPYVIESRYTLRPAPRLALRSAHLLQPDGEAVFRRVCEDLRMGAPDLCLLVTGPWPPYSFTTRSGQSRDHRTTLAALLTGETSLGDSTP
ncbi:MAG TPA: GvpL/GvpF family gas vesicle protein [Ktedonobacterales bacterium]